MSGVCNAWTTHDLAYFDGSAPGLAGLGGVAMESSVRRVYSQHEPAGPDAKARASPAQATVCMRSKAVGLSWIL